MGTNAHARKTFPLRMTVDTPEPSNKNFIREPKNPITRGCIKKNRYPHLDLVKRGGIIDPNTDPVLSFIRDVLDLDTMAAEELALLKLFCQLPQAKRGAVELAKVAGMNHQYCSYWLNKHRMLAKAALFDARVAVGQSAIIHEFGNKEKLQRRIEVSDITSMLLKKFRKRITDGEVEILKIDDFVKIARLEVDMHGLKSGDAVDDGEKMTDEELRRAIRELGKGVTQADATVLRKFRDSGSEEPSGRVEGSSGDSSSSSEEPYDSLLSDESAA